MTCEAAAFDIDLGPYEHWSDAERVIPNIISLYKEFGGAPLVVDMAERWTAMAHYRTKWKARWLELEDPRLAVASPTASAWRFSWATRRTSRR